MMNEAKIEPFIPKDGAKGKPLIVDAQNLPPFPWSLVNAAETWTDDIASIRGMSDQPLIEGLLREREVATVVGAAKTRKTWFALAMALSVAAGEDFIGRTTNQAKVLYLDYELKPSTFRKRMCLLSREKPEAFFYQCLRGAPRLPTAHEIAGLVEREEIRLVVVDSLYRTGWLSEENNNDTTSRELSALQALTERTGCSLLCVDHTAKGGGKDRSAVDASRGASSKSGFFDAIFVLRATDQGEDRAGTYAILDPVLRDWPQIDELPLISFFWSDGHAEVELSRTVPKGGVNVDAAKILEFIESATGPVKLAEVTAAVGLPKETIRTRMKELVEAGKLIERQDPHHRQRMLYSIPDLLSADE